MVSKAINHKEIHSVNKERSFKHNVIHLAFCRFFLPSGKDDTDSDTLHLWRGPQGIFRQKTKFVRGEAAS